MKAVVSGLKLFLMLCYDFNSKGSTFLSKGPSINDVSFKGEGGGCQKWHFEAIFRAKTEATGGGRGV